MAKYEQSLELDLCGIEKYSYIPSEGLPDPLFYFISRHTPLVNVDLLIKNNSGSTLLSWRDDEHCGHGWHIPGGIIRFQETLESRIKAVAHLEIGCDVTFQPKPLDINQVIIPHKKNRSHFISLLYECKLLEDINLENQKSSIGMPGYLKWHSTVPHDLLSYHHIYQKYL